MYVNMMFHLSKLDLVWLQRIGETLDFEIKRWAAGKEGNLRALLSTLQYVRQYFPSLHMNFTIIDIDTFSELDIYI